MLLMASRFLELPRAGRDLCAAAFRLFLFYAEYRRSRHALHSYDKMSPTSRRSGVVVGVNDSRAHAESFDGELTLGSFQYFAGDITSILLLQ